jgi:hypothetical protein
MLIAKGRKTSGLLNYSILSGIGITENCPEFKNLFGKDAIKLQN